MGKRTNTARWTGKMWRIDVHTTASARVSTAAAQAVPGSVKRTLKRTHG